MSTRRVSTLLFLVLFAIAPLSADPAVLPEYEVKAALLFKIVKFVRWPDYAFQSRQESLTLCILGEDPFGDAIDALSGQSVLNRKLVVRRLGNVKAAAERCHLFYISRYEEARVGAALQRTAMEPVLTVGDAENFAESGGMLEFRTENNRIRFLINLGASDRVGIGFNAQLLQLATLITPKGEES